MLILRQAEFGVVCFGLLTFENECSQRTRHTNGPEKLLNHQ